MPKYQDPNFDKAFYKIEKQMPTDMKRTKRHLEYADNHQQVPYLPSVKSVSKKALRKNGKRARKLQQA